MLTQTKKICFYVACLFAYSSILADSNTKLDKNKILSILQEASGVKAKKTNTKTKKHVSKASKKRNRNAAIVNKEKKNSKVKKNSSGYIVSKNSKAITQKEDNSGVIMPRSYYVKQKEKKSEDEIKKKVLAELKLELEEARKIQKQKMEKQKKMEALPFSSLPNISAVEYTTEGSSLARRFNHRHQTSSYIPAVRHGNKKTFGELSEFY